MAKFNWSHMAVVLLGIGSAGQLPAQTLGEMGAAGAIAGGLSSGGSENAMNFKNKVRVQAGNNGFDNNFNGAGSDFGSKEVNLDDPVQRSAGDGEESGSWQSTDRLKDIEVSAMVKVDEVMEASGDYHYAAFGAPNPFARPESITTGIANKDSEEISINGVEIPMISSLQRFPVDSLKLSGIWQLDNGERRALVLTPEREGVIVKINDPIAAGKVIAIEEKKIKTRQYSIRNDGVREYAEVDMILDGQKSKPTGKIILEPGQDIPKLQFEDKNRNSGIDKKTGSMIPTLPANLDSGAGGGGIPSYQAPGGLTPDQTQQPVGSSSLLNGVPVSGANQGVNPGEGLGAQKGSTPPQIGGSGAVAPIPVIGGSTDVNPGAVPSGNPNAGQGAVVPKPNP